MLDPKNEQAMYFLIDLELERSNFSRAKELKEDFILICVNMCDRMESIDNRLKVYDVAFDISKRIEIIQEIDGIWAEVHPTAYGLGENNRKTMWWNKFGYPDWVHTRYGGEFWDAFIYWWYDEEADAKLKAAMSNDQDLPIDPIEIKFWPAYKVKNL